MDDAGLAGFVGNGDGNGPVQDLRGVEDVIDLFVLQQPVGVDAGAGGVEVLAHEGIAGRDVIVQLPLEVLGDLGDHPGVDAVGAALEGDVLDEHAFDGGVAGALAEAEQGAVHRGAAVEPGGGAVDHDLVEVVVAVPFQQVAGDAGVVDHGPHQLGHAPGQGGAGIGHPVAHGVAQPDLDVDAALLAQLHQLDGKGHAEAVDVRPGDVLQMAAGLDAHSRAALTMPRYSSMALRRFQLSFRKMW